MTSVYGMTTNKKPKQSNSKKKAPKLLQEAKKPAASGKKKTSVKSKTDTSAKPLDAAESFAVAASETITTKWNEVAPSANNKAKAKKTTFKSFLKLFRFKK